ncbi:MULTISPECIES: TetR/AcrR family transcriptional regulator [Tsukamurella]|uniref:TetR family transcriptional regulator n=2 Tax=Tsukamurella TaxID=2060 RepID=A0A5C5S424_9ACTN|nr:MULTISPECIES: TetR family transcriptional regulator [Tsukamurella]NMD56769.1 TetR family transcriptional regulator [Tsukamurella columbiensis]TWS29682.1 TetR family transcriptional regulator [Tsukamurella conjunctivitidis]
MTASITSGRSGTRGVPRAVRAAAILEAAAEEFGRAGYASAQLTTIAGRAGVSKALVLAYFCSKEKLYIACVEKAGPIVFDAVAAAVDAPAPAIPGSSLFSGSANAVLTSLFTALDGRTGYWALLYDRTLPAGAGRDAARAQRHRLREQSARTVADVLRSAGLADPRDSAAAVLIWESMVSASMHWWRLNPELSAAELSATSGRILAAFSYPAPSTASETEMP